MTKAVSLAGYAEFLTTLKERILVARATAARAVNHELVQLYWDLGRGLVEKQEQAGWGDGVVRRLAADLRVAFPGMSGLTEPNLWRMQKLYRVHTAPDFLSQAVRVLGPVPDGAVVSDFLSQAVREMVAAVPWGLVAFDLKIGAFEPEHAGKMDFYLNLLNDQQRAPDDQPSIGIILCAEKDDIEVEFALETKQNPIGVAEYQLQTRLPAEFQGRLPTARQLAAAVRDVLPSRK